MMHAPRAQRAILEYSKRDRTGNMGMGNIFFYRLKMGEYMPDVVPEIESKIFLKERKEKKGNLVQAGTQEFTKLRPIFWQVYRPST